MPDAPAPPSFARRVLAVAVGLFATWQLVFIPAANLIDFVPRRLGPPLEPISDSYQARGTFTTIEPLQRTADYTGAVLDTWGELSGQEQGWSMFAPGMPPYSVTPAVEFRFANKPSDTVLSPYEPLDKQNPRLRPTLVNTRPLHIESQLVFPAWFAPPEEIARSFAPPEELAQLPDAYRTLPESARKWRDLARVYLVWHFKKYRAAHPDHPEPVEVVLKHRFIPTPHPGRPRGWTQPVVERPYALWRPADDSYEVYDAVEKRFVSGAKP
jgi:hypothetical protein